MEDEGSRARSKLRDVAKLAGVSPGTASLVLSGKGEDRRISQETKGRILSAAERLNYVPSLLHRSVRRGRTQILSFYNAFQNRETGDLYMDRLAAAVEHAGGRYGYNMLVHCVFEKDAIETYRFLNGGFADGAIVFGPLEDDPLVKMLRQESLPVVVLSPGKPELTLSSVWVDETPGLDQLADELIAHGHRKIVAVGPAIEGIGAASQRFRTLKSRYLQRGIDISDAPMVPRSSTAKAIVESALGQASRPTAIFAWHDRLAYWIVEGCAELGIDVPGDVSVVGYDGLVWPSRTHHVVTSVHYSIEDLGDRAVSLLARLVEGETGPLTAALPARYLAGSTLGPAR